MVEPTTVMSGMSPTNTWSCSRVIGTAPPAWLRIRRFVYHLEPPGAAAWWTRDGEQLWLPPISRDDPELRAVLARYGWPSPSLR